uniref:Uncharacterized protein n=1 Tax=Anguilla anguilla TaxID=7936 RepID=A0A0E9S3T6_ANGAN
MLKAAGIELCECICAFFPSPNHCSKMHEGRFKPSPNLLEILSFLLQ